MKMGKTCDTCGGIIDLMAKQCPHCGAVTDYAKRKKDSRKKKVKEIILVVLGLALLAFAVFGCYVLWEKQQEESRKKMEDMLYNRTNRIELLQSDK